MYTSRQRHFYFRYGDNGDLIMERVPIRWCHWSTLPRVTLMYHSDLQEESYPDDSPVASKVIREPKPVIDIIAPPREDILRYSAPEQEIRLDQIVLVSTPFVESDDQCRSEDSEGWDITEGATLLPIPDHQFFPQEDARVLREAMKGFGTDEKAIVSVLGYRSTKQMKQIEAEYNSIYKGHKTLQEKLEADLSGDLKNLCLRLLNPVESDAKLLREAIKGPGTNEDVLISVICTKTNNELREVIHTYKQLYGDNLLDDVKQDTSGHFREVLTACLKADRPEGGPHDEEAVKKDADNMYQGAETTRGLFRNVNRDTHENVFMDILLKRSREHLKALIQFYRSPLGRDMAQSIDHELDMDNDGKTALKTIVAVISDPVGYASQQFHKAMQGFGTHDDALIRLVVAHCSTDMVQVKQCFYRQYDVPLHRRIEDETSSDYQRLLLALMGEFDIRSLDRQ